MNILLWTLQVVIAFFCAMGSMWRLINFEQEAQNIASLQALPFAVWNFIGVYEIICALGLLLPGIFGWNMFLTPVAAAALAVEMALITGLHVSYFGWTMQATNPAMWSLMLCLLSAFVAYGRWMLRPL